MSMPGSDRLAIAALVVAATLWGVMWWPLRHFEAHGMRGPWLLCYLYGIACVAVFPWMWRTRRDWRRHPGALLLLMLLGGWTNTAFSLAVLHGNILRVMLLFYLSPVWSALGGRLLLGEHLGVRRLGMIMLALAGAGLLLFSEGGGRMTHTPLSVNDGLALSAGLAFSGTNIVLRAWPAIGDANRAGLVWLGVGLQGGLLGLLGPDPIPHPDLLLWVEMLAFSLSWLMLATLAVQYGVTRMELGRSAVILLFEIVAGSLSAYWLAHEAVHAGELLGGLLIVLAALVEALDGRRRTAQA